MVQKMAQVLEMELGCFHLNYSGVLAEGCSWECSFQTVESSRRQRDVVIGGQKCLWGTVKCQDPRDRSHHPRSMCHQSKRRFLQGVELYILKYLPTNHSFPSCLILGIMRFVTDSKDPSLIYRTNFSEEKNLRNSYCHLQRCLFHLASLGAISSLLLWPDSALLASKIPRLIPED